MEVGDVTRFPTAAHVASLAGTAPMDASSGDQIRYRPPVWEPSDQPRPAHQAIVQLRDPREGRNDFERKRNDGKTSLEAATTDSSVTGSHPSAGSSDKPPRGPARNFPKTSLPKAG